MGWYQDEETSWPPDWAIRPLAWVGAVMASVLPTGFTLALLKLAWPAPPLMFIAGLYVVWLGVMLAAIKPWTWR